MSGRAKGWVRFSRFSLCVLRAGRAQDAEPEASLRADLHVNILRSLFMVHIKKQQLYIVALLAAACRVMTEHP